MEKGFFIHSKTFKVLHDSIPKGVDWLKVPEGTALIYHFDGSDPIGDDSIVFYKEGLSHTWSEGLGWMDNSIGYPGYSDILKYVTTYGKLIWSKDLKKELFDTIEKGTKLRIVSLDNTSVGASGFSIGDELLFIKKRDFSACNTLGVMRLEDIGSGVWGISHKDVEVVEVVGGDVGSSINCEQTTQTTHTAQPEQTNTFNPLVPQEGGDHYKLRPIQPIVYSERNGLSMCQGNIVKYITRHKEKNGVEDLAKVIHYALLESYFVYGEQGSTELKGKVLKLLGGV